MKLTYELSRLAEKDLENIWKYTFENWSLKQAGNYINQVIRKIEEVCLHSDLGSNMDYVKLRVSKD